MPELKKNQRTSATFSQEQLYTRNFQSLSARDLLDARDQFHVHLVHKDNVLATAIGFYLIRDDDADAEDHRKTLDAARSRGKLDARTLTNSSTRPWSWPCVLVFVSEWQKMDELRNHPEEVVPPFLYMEDGRIIPVCVVLATASDLPARRVASSRLLADKLEGGAPIFVDAQGQRRMGSVACLVSDGTDYYALTNRHVAGEGGREVKAIFGGVPRVVGVTQPTAMLEELSFSDIYPSLPGRETVVHLDAGLIRLANVSDWAPSVGGKTVGQIADFSGDTASLDWIGCKLVAHGAASGELCGEVRALFYRYKSVGGREYVSEFLIGNRTGQDSGAGAKAAKNMPLMTVPGDSGTLWCVDPKATGGVLRPVALEWGGQRLGDDPKSKEYLQFALASSVAVVCRELGLDIINDFRKEHFEYWGAVGHFKIAQQACFQVQNTDLKNFLVANLDNISFTDNQKLLEATHLQASHFVPLSDVPDVVWKTNVNKVNRAVTRAQENWNHFADMDLPGKDGKTLLDMFAADESSLQWSAWCDFYQSAPLPTEGKGQLSHGSLPFRVWQIFSQLQQLAKQQDKIKFLCAAGIVAHYVGDACQPLHCSQHADGLNGSSTGVHSTYEDNMVELHADDIATGIDQIFQNQEFTPATITSGHDAALEVVKLMQRCHVALPPESICESYNNARPGTHTSPSKSKPVLEAMWKDCGQGTITCIADGIRTLASLWQAAVGEDASWLTDKLDGEQDLRPVYEATDFLPSLHLEHYTQAMIPGSDANGASAPAAAVASAGSGQARHAGSRPAAAQHPQSGSAHARHSTSVNGGGKKKLKKKMAHA